MVFEITATEAARRLSELLNRVQYKGESFVIVRNGERVASLSGASAGKKLTFAQLAEKLRATPTGDPSFAQDLEDIVTQQPRLSEDPWES